MHVVAMTISLVSLCRGMTISLVSLCQGTTIYLGRNDAMTATVGLSCVVG